MKTRVVLVSLISVVLAASMFGCGSGNTSGSSSSSSSSANSSSQSAAAIANPWTSYPTLDEAEQAVGFDITLPFEVAEGDTYNVMDGGMLEVVSLSGNPTTVRKMPGEEDISGDYRQFKMGIASDGVDISPMFRGDSNDEIYVATWTYDGYSYAITVNEPISYEEMDSLVRKTS